MALRTEVPVGGNSDDSDLLCSGSEELCGCFAAVLTLLTDAGGGLATVVEVSVAIAVISVFSGSGTAPAGVVVG